MAVIHDTTRLLRDGETPPVQGGCVSATWERPDGSMARGIVAIAR
jgi:hypothetical protein